MTRITDRVLTSAGNAAQTPQDKHNHLSTDEVMGLGKQALLWTGLAVAGVGYATLKISAEAAHHSEAEHGHLAVHNTAARRGVMESGGQAYSVSGPGMLQVPEGQPSQEAQPTDEK